MKPRPEKKQAGAKDHSRFRVQLQSIRLPSLSLGWLSSSSSSPRLRCRLPCSRFVQSRNRLSVLPSQTVGKMQRFSLTFSKAREPCFASWLSSLGPRRTAPDDCLLQQYSAERDDSRSILPVAEPLCRNMAEARLVRSSKERRPKPLAVTVGGRNVPLPTYRLASHERNE